jgi:sugar phosphate isomerase/epimerase
VISLPHRTMLDLSPPELVRVAAGAGFQAVGFPLIPVLASERAWRLLEAGCSMPPRGWGARFITVTTTDTDEGRIAAHFAELCAEAARYGLRLGLEFMVRAGGDLPLVELMRALPADIPVALEVPRQWSAPADAEQFARRAFEATEAVLTAAK